MQYRFIYLIFLLSIILTPIIAKTQGIATPEVEVRPGDRTEIENELLVSGVFSLKEGRHGKVFFESTHIQDNHAISLSSTFTNIDFSQTGKISVKLFLQLRRHGVDQSSTADILMFRQIGGLGGWFVSSQNYASNHGFANVQVWGVNNTLYISGGGDAYTVFGTVEVMIE